MNSALSYISASGNSVPISGSGTTASRPTLDFASEAGRRTAVGHHRRQVLFDQEVYVQRGNGESAIAWQLSWESWWKGASEKVGDLLCEHTVCEHTAWRAIDSPGPSRYLNNPWGCGAIGSALEWHSRGYGFDPRQLH